MNPARLSCALGCALVCAAALLSSGCANRPKPYDYTAFRQAKPATLLVLPPINDSTDVKATAGVWSHATLPLAEAGYYVLPVTLVDETFRQNGVTVPQEAHAIAHEKLRDYFGADAAVYLRVTRYGTTYAVIASETRVDVEARVVDLRSGQLLWAGKAFAASSDQQAQGGLAGLLVGALVKQIVGVATDAAYNFAGGATSRLLGAPRFNGMLVGPRSRDYGKPPPEN